MDKYKDIKEPNDLEEIIERAYKKAKEENKSNVKTKFTKIGSTAAAIMIVFAISVNTSMAFANYLDDIPVLDKLVQFFKFDRGLEEAGKKGFLQVIDKTSEDKGITFKIEDVVYDNRRMVIKYSFSSKDDLENIWMVWSTVTYGDGSDFEGALTSVSPMDDNNNHNMKTGIIDIDVKGKINKEKKTIIIYPKFDKIGASTTTGLEEITGNWKVEIPIKYEQLEDEVKEYKIDTKFNVEDIEINIKELRMYPTVGELKVKFDDENSDYEFSGFTETYLIDGKGKKFRNTSSNFLMKGERTVRFESNYFIDNSNMKLNVGGIYVTPKNEYDFYVDLKNESSNSNCDYDIKIEFIQKKEDGNLDLIVISVEDDRLVNEYINIGPLLEIHSIELEDGTKLEYQEDYFISSSPSKDKVRFYIEIHKPIAKNLKFKISNLHEYRPINKKFNINNR